MAYTTINKPDQYFNTVLYAGTGATNSVTGVNFKPDFVWVKNRSGANSHGLQDFIRGPNLQLASSDSNAEADFGSTGMTSFNSDGFTVVSHPVYNASSNNYVSWNWLAANSTTSNTSGTITSTVSANTTSGFSIVSYTGNGTSGATIGHGLGAVPKMIIVKNRNGTNQWLVYHASLGATKYMILETTGAVGTASTIWNDTTPTTSLFTVGNSSSVNGSTLTYIAYCFADVKGFSKFGSYTGNGSTDGPFIYTGFKPAFLIAKRSSSTGNWRTRDNKRSTYNAVELVLNPNLSAAETTEDAHDFLSNGFKVRTSGPENNSSGGTFIYMAFAENPFVSSTFIPTTAR